MKYTLKPAKQASIPRPIAIWDFPLWKAFHNGKTHISIGLGLEAIQKGYQVMFIAMGELVHLLKTKEFSRKSQTLHKRLIDSDLVIIDDMMYMAMDTKEANLFFHLINELYDKSSIIITSNKGPNEWGDLLGDEG